MFALPFVECGAMTHIAGVDGTPGGWAVVIVEEGRSVIRKVAALSDILDGAADFDIIAVDVPIGLLDAYEVGGRACDREEVFNCLAGGKPMAARSEINFSSPLG